MGWKNLKDKFGIRHHVHVENGLVCVGSGFVPCIVSIDPDTGALEENEALGGFLRQYYPELRQATPQELRALLQAPDQFSASIPVYTYENGVIIEKVCETPGWPNATHDGRMMFENTYSTDKNQVIAWAKENARLEVKYIGDGIVRREAELAEAHARLVEAQARLAALEKTYPAETPSP